MIKQVKDIRKGESSTNTFSYTILHENGSIEEYGSTTYLNISNNSLDKNNSNNIDELLIDDSNEIDNGIFYNDNNMIKSQLNSNFERFLQELPNMNPISKPDTIQLPRKISEVRIQNIEQMVLENPIKMNFRQKYELKPGSEISLKVISDPTLDDSSMLFSIATKKEIMKRDVLKKKSEKKKNENKMKRVNCIETSEGYSTFMKTETEACNCSDKFHKEFPFGMKELEAMVHNMKYLKTIVNSTKELTEMLETHCERT